MSTLIRIRGGSKTEWADANSLLADRELAAEFDDTEQRYMLKVGDGHTLWNDLPYFRAESFGVDSIQGRTGAVDLHGHDIGALERDANLNDLPDKAAAREHLGLQGAALQPVSAFDAAGAADTARAAAIQRSAHTGTQTSATISDLVEVIQDTVGAMVVSGGAVTLAYDDAAGTLKVTAPVDPGTDDEVVRDTIGAALRGVQGVTIGVNDAADTITLGISGLSIGQVTGLQDALDARTTASNANAQAIVDALLLDKPIAAGGTCTPAKTNVATGAGAYNAPAVVTQFDPAAPRRFGFRNEHTTALTVTFPDGATVDVEPGATRFWRQTSATGYKLENGIPLARLKELFAAKAAGVPTGGTTGQRLTKASNNDLDVVWADAINPDTSGHVPETQMGLAARQFSLSRRTGASAETVPRQMVNGFVALASGLLQIGSIALVKGQPVSKIGFFSQAGGASMTNQWFALWGPTSGNTPALLGVTNDDGSTAWGAATEKVLNLTSTVTAPADGLYYVTACVVIASGGTMPQLVSNNVITANTVGLAPMLAGRDLVHQGLTGPAAAPLSATMTAQTQIVYGWVA